MKNSRLFEILYLLVEKRAVTAGELARRLEVSERTIYRDVDALSAAGIPVYAQKGKGGGIRLMDQFVLDRALLSQEQQDSVPAVRPVPPGGERLAGGGLCGLGQRSGGAGEFLPGEALHSGAPALIVHILQLRRGEEPPGSGVRPAGV